MKLWFLIAAATTMINGLSANGLPPKFLGRWTYDEDATVEQWPRLAKDSDQRARYEHIAKALPKIRAHFGKPEFANLDITTAALTSGGGFLNPRFEMISATEKEGRFFVQARVFQVANDDNPHETKLVLSESQEKLVVEVWDGDVLGKLYVLKRLAR